MRSLRRSQALVSPDRRSPSLSQVDDMFASNFVPHRRVISCESDLDSLHSVGPSVFGSSVSPRSVSCVSGCCGARVGEGGARCGVRSEHVDDCVNLEGGLSGHNSWKHGHETRNKDVDPEFGVQGWVFLRRYCYRESGTGTVFTRGAKRNES